MMTLFALILFLRNYDEVENKDFIVKESQNLKELLEGIRDDITCSCDEEEYK